MIVLQYDPYSQTARFKSESEETGAVSDFKNLNKSQKDALKMLEENIILQNQIENLVKVLKTIDSRQRFRFIGTMKDYRDFEAGLKELAPSGCVENRTRPSSMSRPTSANSFRKSAVLSVRMWMLLIKNIRNIARACTLIPVNWIPCWLTVRPSFLWAVAAQANRLSLMQSSVQRFCQPVMAPQLNSSVKLSPIIIVMRFLISKTVLHPKLT